MLTLTARTVRRDRSWGEHGRLVERMSHGEDSEKRWVLRWAQKTGREDSHDEDSENRWVLRRAQKTGRENESLRGLWEEMGFEAGTEDWQRGSVPVRTVRRDGSWGEPERLVGMVSRWCAKADCCKLSAGNARLLMVISCSWRQWIMVTWLRLMGLDSVSTSLPCSPQDPLTASDCLSLSL